MSVEILDGETIRSFVEDEQAFNISVESRFASLDTDNNGRLSYIEMMKELLSLRVIETHFGVDNIGLSHEELVQVYGSLFSRFDHNGDGTVDLEEFRAEMKEMMLAVANGLGSHAQNPSGFVAMGLTDVLLSLGIPANDANHAHVVSISMFVAVLCLCIVIGHLLEENRWINESITAILIGCITGTIILLLSEGKSSHILRFDEELFFIYLLPPIIFNAGFQVKKKQFFHNFFTINLFGVVGVFISVAIISQTGLVTAYCLKALYFGKHSADREIALMVLVAYLSYILAELLQLSGIITVFFCGIVMSHYAMHNVTEKLKDNNKFTIKGVTSDPVNAAMITNTVVVVLFTTLVFGFLTRPLINFLLPHLKHVGSISILTKMNQMNICHCSVQRAQLAFSKSREVYLPCWKDQSIQYMPTGESLMTPYMRPIFGGPS
ncbi:hypothetical protein J5N97_005366 [Dioscorea zingiberensis]|uniref:EF-hand domain-containing protein n=1 Tax=Dioscorea zingiberensis TaxID=325984 RepID=A0A9D5DAC4_9LILI|nr:hypothetical protein J5N97_005366 [Dioscorea zingiberensis]